MASRKSALFYGMLAQVVRARVRWPGVVGATPTRALWWPTTIPPGALRKLGLVGKGIGRVADCSEFIS